MNKCKLFKIAYGFIRFLPADFAEKWRSAFYRGIGLRIGANVRLAVGSLIDVWDKDIWLNIGDNVFVGENSVISGGVEIGRDSSINSNVSIIASRPSRIRIGVDCLIGQNVVIRADDHRFETRAQPIKNQGKVGGDIAIGDDCWLGANAIILKGVSLEAHSVVGAGAVVTKNFPAYSVVVGNPAKLLKTRGQ